MKLGLGPAFRPLGASRANMLVIAVAYAVFAVSLLLQPSRWGLTPAYHDLLAIMPQGAWGVLFAAVSAFLGAAAWPRPPRWLPVAALSAGLAVTTCWCAAFVIRWATSPNTTPETWVSWALFDYVLLRALALLDREEGRAAAPRDRAPRG